MIARLSILFTLAAIIFCFSPRTSNAFPLFNDPNNPSNACSGQANNSPTCQQAQNQGGAGTNRLTGANSIIQDAADVVAVITGVAAIIMIIISALTMATSAGNTEAVTSSRRRLVAALIGLAIVALAWTIISFVTNRFIL